MKEIFEKAWTRFVNDEFTEFVGLFLKAAVIVSVSAMAWTGLTALLWSLFGLESGLGKLVGLLVGFLLTLGLLMLAAFFVELFKAWFTLRRNS